MRRFLSALLSRKTLAIVALAGLGLGYRALAKKFTGPGDDILIPEGATPSWLHQSGATQ